ncbi:MAG: cysteine desulfurase [Chloroflexi bacterium]|nr:cysteine desulfurase [Chloroflexota bacterium]
MFDARAIRKQFPILERQVHGVPLVYLDNAATSQKPQAVLDALTDYYTRYNANVHRGIHTLAEEATAAYEAARARIARFIGAAGPEGVLLTRNTTEAINLVAYAWGRRHLREGDEVLLTEMEHHSNLVPWHLLAAEQGVRLRHIGITDEGYLDLSNLDELLTERTRLVSVTHMSNVLGTINPVRLLAERAHQVGAMVLVDGAQSVPHLPVDVADLGCDLLAFSSHKMLGPTGVGVLYGRPEVLETFSPFLGGGEMIQEVYLDHSTYADLPHRFEAGTPNIADAIAFGAAIDFLSGLGMEQVREHEVALTSYALRALSQVDGLTIYGPQDPQHRGGVIAFNLEGVHPHDLGTLLDQMGVAVRAGHHCAQPLMRRLGVPATARASFYLYTTEEEIDVLVTSLEKVKEFFVNAGRRAGRAV